MMVHEWCPGAEIYSIVIVGKYCQSYTDQALMALRPRLRVIPAIMNLNLHLEEVI